MQTDKRSRVIRVALTPSMAQKVYAHADENDCSGGETIKEILAIGFSSAPSDAATLAARTRGFNEVRNLVISRSAQFFRDLADELEAMGVTEQWKHVPPQEEHAP